MKKILLMVTIFSITSLYAAGALAINGNQGDAYGFSHGFNSSGQAQSRALNECGGGCYVVKTFSNTCAAYAADQASGSTVYGWATRNSGGSAKNAALNQCRNQGGSQCMVRAWACDQ